jgi:6-phospho-beta-glucosidase
VKIAILGGSGIATPQLVDELARRLGPELSVCLIGRSHDKLQTVAAAAARRNPQVRITTAGRVADGVRGADLVLNQVRVGGLDGRAWDEKVPTEYGMIGEETVGAGGFALGYRTLPVVRAMARVVGQVAPDAWFVNLTNPAGLVLSALAAETSLRAISVCDIPVSMTRAIDRIMPSVRPHFFGTNHASAVVAAEDADGRDAMPGLTGTDTAGGPTAEWARRAGVIASPYLRYYLDPSLRPAAPAVRSRADDLLALQAAVLDRYRAGDSASGDAAVAQRNPHWYAEVVAPVIATLLGSSEPGRFVVQLPNNGLVPFLRPSAAVEVTAEVGRDRVEPLPVPDVPAELKVLTLQLTEADELTRRASLSADPELAIRALALNPLVPDERSARSFWHAVADRWPDPNRQASWRSGSEDSP